MNPIKLTQIFMLGAELLFLAWRPMTGQGQITTAPAFPTAGVAEASRIPLQVGDEKVIEDVEKFEIADGKILMAKPIEEGRLIIKGLSGGTTTLLVQKKGTAGLLRYTVDVTGISMENVLKRVKEALGGIPGVLIVRAGDTIEIKGKIVSRDDGKRIDNQKRANGDAILDLTERAYFDEDLSRLQRDLQDRGSKEIQVGSELGLDGQKMLTLNGTVYSDRQKEDLLATASKFFDSSRIVNNVKVMPPQIEIDIEAYAIDMGKGHDIGRNDLLGQISTIESSGWSFKTGPGGSMTYPTISLGSFKQNINALVESGVATNVSKQHASVRSGEKAEVKSTRTLHVPVSGVQVANLEKVTVGQLMKIQPTYQGNDQFETKVSVEVSSFIGDPGAIQTKESTLESSFISRRDEVVVLGGSRSSVNSQDTAGTPFLQRIPIVNLFFRKSKKVGKDTVDAYFMTLRAPTVQGATEPKFSEEAAPVKDDVKRRTDESRGKLR